MLQLMVFERLKNCFWWLLFLKQPLKRFISFFSQINLKILCCIYIHWYRRSGRDARMRLLSASVLKNWNPSALMIPDTVEPMFRLLRCLPNFPEVWLVTCLLFWWSREPVSPRKCEILIMKLLFFKCVIIKVAVPVKNHDYLLLLCHYHGNCWHHQGD